MVVVAIDKITKTLQFCNIFRYLEKKTAIFYRLLFCWSCGGGGGSVIVVIVVLAFLALLLHLDTLRGIERRGLVKLL